jgi:glycosyltransferase involved in cell wall biosynthesis
MTFGAVAIGRNEGARLGRCLASMPAGVPVVYVDSGSGDGSVDRARELGASVVELDLTVPFTAARARNAGYECLIAIAPHIEFVLFIDGDCQLARAWPATAIAFLHERPEVAAVAGRRREQDPQRSVYNWLCDREWDRPPGEAAELGGDIMVRLAAFRAEGGYRDDLIAGEEPELCVRLRAAGWRVWRLDEEMTTHDADMTRFGQWWRRTVRSGYAYAQGHYLHGAGPARHYAWEYRRAWLWGLVLPLACLGLGLAFWPWGWLSLLIYPLQFLRQTLRQTGPLADRTTIALFQMLARFAEAAGQLRFLRDRLLGRQARLIEYK